MVSTFMFDASKNSCMTCLISLRIFGSCEIFLSLSEYETEMNEEDMFIGNEGRFFHYKEYNILVEELNKKKYQEMHEQILLKVSQ